MHSLRHFYYQNKEKIWKVILVTALVLAIIYLLNNFEKYNKGESSNESNNRYQYNDEKIYIEKESAVSGETIRTNEVTQINETIAEFLDKCKAAKYEEAYNMLSPECKEIKYNTLAKFIQQYVNKKFEPNQTYSIQKWEGSTYKVEISQDILTSGDINTEKKVLEYITIVDKEGAKKLNINEYIGRRNVNAKHKENNVEFTIVSKEVYMDYEIYKLKIGNFSNNTIKIDAFEDTDSIYINDESGNKYNAHKNELLEHELVVKPGITFETMCCDI